MGETKKTSGLAVASLILGLLGLCVPPLALVGLILGIIALVSIGRSAGQLGGKGLAIGGTICSGVGLLVIPIMIVAIAIPSFKQASMAANETRAIGALKAYTTAQEQYRMQKNTYAADFTKLNSESLGGPLIDPSMAQADSPDKAHAGYYFVSIRTRGGKPLNTAFQHGLCAVPAKYPQTGRRTFLADETGTIFQVDNGGRPVTDMPADPTAEGWQPAGY